MATRRIGPAFALPAGAAATAEDFPGLALREPESNKRTLVTGGFAAGIHLGALGLLVLLASLAPVIEDKLIPVQLLKQETPEEPAPAPKALAERRFQDFAPSVQAFQPQIINPRVIADASPVLAARTLQMDAVASVQAPTQIRRSTTVVEHVSSVRSAAVARASNVDVSNVGGPVVRGPVKLNSPAGPSVGPRKVESVATGTSGGTGKLQIGGGSSVREGVLSNRDVLGSPDGAPLVSVDTAIGEGAGPGAGGSGTGRGAVTASAQDCFARPEVQSYLGQIESRTLDRWILPPSVDADQQVTLRFSLDVAGSASRVSLVRATDKNLGASAVDALRAASPFPPLPDQARCLARLPITATFSNPVAG